MATIQACSEANMWCQAADIRSGKTQKRLDELQRTKWSQRREDDNSTAPSNDGAKLAFPHQFLTGQDSFYDNTKTATAELALCAESTLVRKDEFNEPTYPLRKRNAILPLLANAIYNLCKKVLHVLNNLRGRRSPPYYPLMRQQCTVTYTLPFPPTRMISS